MSHLRKLVFRRLIVIPLLSLLAACGGASNDTENPRPDHSQTSGETDSDDDSNSSITPENPAAIDVALTPEYEPIVFDTVTTSTGTFEFTTAEYELDNNGSIERFNLNNKVSSTFETRIIENAYLKVTLLPGYGGRILSLINKTTGSEVLYQNPVGVPYGINEGNFLFDWLQIAGGIFPTYGPEHGKSWNQPWHLNLVKETADEVIFELKWVDDFNVEVPQRFVLYGNATGAELSYRISLKAGRAALDTEVFVHNPTADALDYEYWTNVSLAPGSIPGNSRAAANTEIIYPLEFVSSSWCLSEQRCQLTVSIETPTSLSGIFKFDLLRRFENWLEWGIFYAWPDMSNRNFWGVINRNNDEGVIRVADNQMTKGLKIWTFGYDSSVEIDPFIDASFYRPFIELWAGNVTEFFETSRLLPNATHTQKEVYATTVGLSNVTHANDNFVVNFRVENEVISVDIFALYPDQEVRVVLSQSGGQSTTNEVLKTSAKNPIRLTIPFESTEGNARLSVTTTENEILFDAILAVP